MTSGKRCSDVYLSRGTVVQSDIHKNKLELTEPKFVLFQNYPGKEEHFQGGKFVSCKGNFVLLR